MKVLKRQNLYGRLFADGDKSITIRALLLGSLSEIPSQIENPLISADTLATIDCIKKLGASVEKKDNILIIRGGKFRDNVVLNCKNSGTTARLLIGMLSGLNITATITGDESLSSRPMARVIEPLRERGADITSANGKLPILIKPAKLLPFEYEMPIDSAQVKSAILLSGLTSEKITVVKEKNKTRNHTEKLLEFMGAEIKVEKNEITLSKGLSKPLKTAIPSDPSSCFYYLALGLCLGEITVPNVLLTDTRAGFLKILHRAGGKFKIENQAEKGCFLTGDITAEKSDIDYFEVKKEEIPSCIDDLPLLAVLGAKNKGCRIFGAEELKVKESNRFLGILNLINLAGGKCRMEGDDLLIEGELIPQYFSYSSTDHRMTMTAFVLMIAGCGGNLTDENSAYISFPNIFKNYNNLNLGLIGKDVSSSPSGRVHSAILKEIYDESFTYECLSLKDENLDEFLNKCPYKAFNVTVPYKKEVAKRLYKASGLVEISSSSNFVTRDEKGRFCGYNTDGKGLIMFLESRGHFLKGKTVLISGAGGAGAGIAYAFLQYGSDVYIKNRTMARAEEISFRSGGKIKVYNGEKCHIIINATTLKDETPFSREEIENCEIVVDINYGCETKTIKEGIKANKKFVYNGLGMLFYQAYLSDIILLEKKEDLTTANCILKKFNW